MVLGMVLYAVLKEWERLPSACHTDGLALSSRSEQRRLPQEAPRIQARFRRSESPPRANDAQGQFARLSGLSVDAMHGPWTG